MWSSAPSPALNQSVSIYQVDCQPLSFPTCVCCLRQPQLMALNTTPPLAVAAAKGGSVACLQILLQAGAGVDSVTAERGTALMLAALERLLAFVNVLLQNGASPHTRNKMGASAAMLAAQSGSPECLKAILDLVAILTRWASIPRPLPSTPPPSMAIWLACACF